MVKKKFKLNPFEKALFLFCGKRSDRIKALYYEENGFVLLYKRLENAKFQWSLSADEVKQISPRQFGLLMK